MMHKAWSSIEEVPYCFSRSSIKFQGHTGQNITDFDPNWAFRTTGRSQLSNPSDLPCCSSWVFNPPLEEFCDHCQYHIHEKNFRNFVVSVIVFGNNERASVFQWHIRTLLAIWSLQNKTGYTRGRASKRSVFTLVDVSYNMSSNKLYHLRFAYRYRRVGTHTSSLRWQIMQHLLSSVSNCVISLARVRQIWKCVWNEGNMKVSEL